VNKRLTRATKFYVQIGEFLFAIMNKKDNCDE